MSPDLAHSFRNWPLQLLALFIGATLWYAIVAEDQVDMVMTVPLELRGLSPEMVIANQHRKDLEVSVHGPKRLLQELQQQNISRPVNLAEVTKPGAFVVRNTADSVPFPRGVSVQRVQPANITLMLDRLVMRRIPVVAKTVGIPAFGFSLESVTLTPNSIEVSGPMGLLDSVSAIHTAPIDVEGLTGGATVQAPLVLSEPLQKLIGEVVVEAEIGIKEPMTRRTVQRVPVTLGPAGKNLRARPDTVAVTADIPTAAARETEDLITLFSASANPNEADGEGNAPVHVQPAELPGHSAITVFSFRPEQVRLERMEEEPDAVTERAKQESKRGKEDKP